MSSPISLAIWRIASTSAVGAIGWRWKSHNPFPLNPSRLYRHLPFDSTVGGPPATMAHWGSSIFVVSMATIQYGPAKAAIMHDGEDGEDDAVSCARVARWHRTSRTSRTSRSSRSNEAMKQ